MSTIEMFRYRSKRASRLFCSSENEERSKYIHHIVSCERENRGPSTDPDAPDGTLLRAKPDNGLSNKIAVDFQGDDFDERTTFYLEPNEEHEATSLKCYLGNQQYCLCVSAEYDTVYLVKADTCDPNNLKSVLFKIKHTNEQTRFRTIKSLKTGMFLVSDERGNVSMRLLHGEPQDRQAWFDLKDVHGTETGSYQSMTIIRENMAFTENWCGVEAMRAKVATQMKDVP